MSGFGWSKMSYMKKIRIFVFLLTAVLVLGGCTPEKKPDGNAGGEIISGSKMITAKQGYGIALPETRKFSSDSYLAGLDTTGVRQDGKSNTWYVLFYSPAKNTNLKVNVVGGKVERTEEKDEKKKDRIVDGWVDSTDVARVATPMCKEAGETTEANYFVNLDPGKGGGSPVWNFNCLVGENKTFKVYVNALTGEFTRTGKAGIGW